MLTAVQECTGIEYCNSRLRAWWREIWKYAAGPDLLQTSPKVMNQSRGHAAMHRQVSLSVGASEGCTDRPEVSSMGFRQVHSSISSQLHLRGHLACPLTKPRGFFRLQPQFWHQP